MSKTRIKPRNTMAPRMGACRNPGYVILRATRKRLFEMWDKAEYDIQTRADISKALLLIDLCISRVNSTLEA